MSTTTAAETAPLSSMAAALFFAVMVMTYITLTTHEGLFSSSTTNNESSLRALYQAANHPRAQPVQWRQLSSLYTLLQHFSLLGIILFYAYLCEYHPPHPHGEKVYDRDMFFFLTALLLLVAAFTHKSHHRSSTTTKTTTTTTTTTTTSVSLALQWTERPIAPPEEATELLNRDQTEEWKGWMQFIFLLYHYYHAEEVYNCIRVMITSYVWMTGFGNVSFFYLQQDYSLTRVVQMLWRLNFLVVFLCWTQGTTYILYYICLLHTFFFGMVYITMRTQVHLNTNKYGIRIKFMVLAFVIYIIWDLDLGLFQLLHGLFLGQTPMLGATGGALWEWYFRSTLDHWSTFFGMIFALNFPITSLFFRKLEAQPWYWEWSAKFTMAVALITATHWWITHPFAQNKFDYNQTNAYFACIPVYTYIFLRNLTPWLRGHTLELLHQIGKTTLETYLMQHHIWLTSNAKTLLILIPGWPKCNFLLVSVIYVVLSRRLYTLTLFLRGMLLPNDWNQCRTNLIGLMGAMGACHAIAWALQVVGMLNLTSVAAVAAVISVTLSYRLVRDTSPTATKSVHPVATKPWLVSCFTGWMVVLVFGLVWHHMALNGATKVQPLSDVCASEVIRGDWISVNLCNEETRGAAYRDEDIGSLGVCPASPSVWGWTQSDHPECRMVARDKGALQNTLKHRRLVFVGDSMIRHLYFAMARQLGDAKAGAYNTTLDKWSNYENKYGSVELEFKWAPYVYDVTEQVAQAYSRSDIDMLILGGGAWDRLHHYPNSQAAVEMEQNVTKLVSAVKKQKQHSDIPIVWVTPTTINDWALTDDAKRAHLPESNMLQLRSLYQKQGIEDAVDWTLPGPVFTRTRVTESYDGVHYPLPIYHAGAQILSQTFDWLLRPLSPEKNDTFTPKRPGEMSNPILGLMMLCLAFIGLFGFDGFLGASYLVYCFVPKVIPKRLYTESFRQLHLAAGLPPITEDDALDDFQVDKSKSSDYVEGNEDSDEERERFLQEDAKGFARKDVELTIRTI